MKRKHIVPEKFTCDNCEKTCKELVTRQGFKMSFYVEWVCEKCFEKLEGISFDNIQEEDIYKLK